MYRISPGSKTKSNPGKRIIIAIVILIVGICLFKLLLGSGTNTKQNNGIVLDAIDYTGINLDTIEFASQKVDLDNPKLFDLKERLEKEVLITLYIDYQLILRIKRTGLYFDYIEEQLKINGLPDDLKYLAVAESYLKDTVTSSAGAGGIWQFMPATGKQYGLIINENVDERNNYKKATQAAIKYLKFLNSKFDGDWFLAMAGYNMGENGLARVMSSQEEKDYFALILNEETSRYIFRILAVKFIFENREKLGIKIDEQDFYSLPKTTTIKVAEIKDLKAFIKSKGISMYSFVQLNPWIKYQNNVLRYRSDGQDREILLLSE